METLAVGRPLLMPCSHSNGSACNVVILSHENLRCSSCGTYSHPGLWNKAPFESLSLYT